MSEFGELNEVYDFWFGIGQDHPPTSVLVKKELQRKLIYHMSPQEVKLPFKLSLLYIYI